MPNEMLNNMEFDQYIKGTPDRELLEFVARQIWETNQRCPLHEDRIKVVENRDTRMFGVSGGIGGIISGIIVGIITHFKGS